MRDGGRPYVFSASTRDGMHWAPSQARQPLWGDGSGECQIARVGPGGRTLVMLARAQRNGTAAMGDDVNGTRSPRRDCHSQAPSSQWQIPTSARKGFSL